MSALANWQIFKRRYGEFINPLPSEDTIANYGKFVAQDRRPGENYNFPIKVGNEHGQTANIDGSAFALNAPIDSVVLNAQLDGATIMLRGTIPYDVTAKSSNGAGDGSKGGAFWQAMDGKVEMMMSSGELYRELALMYGPGTAAAAAANLGACAASISGANLAAPQVITITRATWAAGIWNQLAPNALVDIYQADGTTVRETGVTVQSQVAATNRLSLFKTGSVATVAAGDVIVPFGWRLKSCYGLQAILENSGSLFGISATTYNVWKSVAFANGSAVLTRAKIGQIAARLFPNGLTKGGTLFVSGPTFADLAEEADALVRFTDSNTSDVKRQGDNRIEYRSPIGIIRVQLHRFMKQSIAFFIANDVLKRVGATDLTFALPGTNKWFYKELENTAGSQIALYSNQAPVLEIPYHCAIISAISNNGDTSPA